MNPEEYLDRLIERRERGEGPLPVLTDTVAVSLAAASVLVQLREIAVPSEFAGHLERSIRARTLAQQNGRTSTGADAARFVPPSEEEPRDLSNEECAALLRCEPRRSPRSRFRHPCP